MLPGEAHVGDLGRGRGGQLKTLTNKVKKLQTAVATAMMMSNDAPKESKEAITHATTANTNAYAAKNTVNAFFSKNPSLKRRPPTNPTPQRQTPSEGSVLPRLFSGVVRGLAMSFPFVVVPGGWPSALMAIISLPPPHWGLLSIKITPFF